MVVESRSTGGSMLTAAEALDRDVPVLAVPGHPTALAAAGTLDLICDGATPVRDADDVLVAIGLGGTRPVRAASGGQPDDARFGPLESRLLAELDVEPRSLGDLVAALAADLGSDLEEVAAVLVALEDGGHVVRSGPWFEGTGRSSAAARQRRGPS